MKIHKILAVTGLVLLLIGCGDTSEEEKDLFSIEIKNQKKGYTTSDSVSVLLGNKKNKAIDSVVYSLNSERLTSSKKNTDASLSLANQKLGKRTINATVYSDGDTYSATKEIILLASEKPILYTYKVLETYPHDIEAYTQGLEFENDVLYESTGRYKHSSLRKTDVKTGEVIENIALADSYFGEGLTILNDKVYQLTWQENTGFIYNLSDLKKTGSFVYGQSKEGWGLCNDGQTIFKSDGTEKIWSLNTENLKEEGHIELYTNTSKIPRVNELEWVDGKIYANIYGKDAVAIVNPLNGAVEGVIDLSDLKDKVTQHKALDVLNGIAYNGEPNILYITGKNWDKLFKVEVVEK